MGVDNSSTKYKARKEVNVLTDSTLLRTKLTESGYKLGFVADQCGLTYQGFKNKVDGKHDFTAPEIYKLRDLLRLSPDEVEAIFFANDVDKTST